MKTIPEFLSELENIHSSQKERYLKEFIALYHYEMTERLCKVKIMAERLNVACDLAIISAEKIDAGLIKLNITPIIKLLEDF